MAVDEESDRGMIVGKKRARSEMSDTLKYLVYYSVDERVCSVVMSWIAA